MLFLGALLVILPAIVVPFAVSADAPGAKLSLGVVLCHDEPFNVRINRTRFIGNLLGTPIHKVERVELEFIGDKIRDQIKTLHRKPIVESFLSSAGFYYSYCEKVEGCYNLWKSAVYNTEKDRRTNEAQDYFIANLHMLANVNNHKLPDGFKTIEAIRGFVGMGCTNVDNQLICSAMISRTSSHRTGPRLHSRGSDFNGNVSNFVEIETLIAKGRKVASFLQVRGSIPFRWTQLPSWTTYFVPVEIPESTMPDKTSQTAFDNHIKLLESLYSPMTLSVVSLIDQNGKYEMENQLAAELDKLVKGHSGDYFKKENFVPFGYRAAERESTQADCKNYVSYQNFTPEPWLCKLMDQVNAKTLTFSIIEEGMVKSSQDRIVRSSCLSTLDRTSAVQKGFSDFVSIGMLKSINESSTSIPTTMLNWMISAWVSVANAISEQYAGTPAKKADVLTGGKSTFFGRLYDNSIMSFKRHFNANYSDRWKVKAMTDVFGKDATERDYVLWGKKDKTNPTPKVEVKQTN